MNSYPELLDRVMDSILTGDAEPAKALLREKSDFPVTAQLNVYIDGYRLRLREALESAYPALLHYLGKREFLSLADGFITAHPSRHFNLDAYAIAFARYVAKHSQDVFACELAMLEGAIHDVYQREETPAIEAGWAQHQTPATLAEAVLLPRAASCLLAFTHPADDYLTAFRAGEKPGKPTAQDSWLLVVRHKNRVNRLPLMQGEYALFSLLSEGLTLAQALENPTLAQHIAKEDFARSLQNWLGRWVSEGVLRNPS